MNEFDTFSRRGFLGDVYTAFAGVGFVHLLSRDAGADEKVWQPGRGEAHFPTKAKRVLQIFCPGAASHMDLWEHKPALEKYHGKPMPGKRILFRFRGRTGT